MPALEGVCLNPYPAALINFMTVIIVILLSIIAGVYAYYFYLKRQQTQKEVKEEFDDVTKDGVKKDQQDNVADYEQSTPEKSGQ